MKGELIMRKYKYIIVWEDFDKFNNQNRQELANLLETYGEEGYLYSHSDSFFNVKILVLTKKEDSLKLSVDYDKFLKEGMKFSWNNFLGTE